MEIACMAGKSWQPSREPPYVIGEKQAPLKLLKSVGKEGAGEGERNSHK